MKDKELLNDIFQNAEMGRDGVMHVIELSDDPNFREALQTQLTEYQNIYDSADKMIQERGEKPTGANPIAKISAYAGSTMKAMTDNTSSHMADLMIQGSTMGITKMTRELHEYEGKDQQIQHLAEKQIKTEQANIEQMKKFL